MFDNIMSEINNLSKNDVDSLLSRRATLSDFCIGFYNKNAENFGSKVFYQTMTNKEKVKALGNAMAFRVGEVLGLGDVEVKSLMRKIEEDKPLSLTDEKKSDVKTGLKIKGFTLIELMITVAIVGSLSAFAIPVYQAHIAKAQVSEGITLAEGFKSGVSEFYANNGIFPKLSDLGMSGALGKWVADTSIESNGVIVATFNSDVVKGLNGKTLSLTPTLESSGNLSWACSSNAPQDYLPKSCLEAVASGGSGGDSGNSGSGDDENTQPSEPSTPTKTTFDFASYKYLGYAPSFQFLADGKLYYPDGYSALYQSSVDGVDIYKTTKGDKASGSSGATANQDSYTFTDNNTGLVGEWFQDSSRINTITLLAPNNSNYTPAIDTSNIPDKIVNNGGVITAYKGGVVMTGYVLSGGVENIAKTAGWI